MKPAVVALTAALVLLGGCSASAPAASTQSSNAAQPATTTTNTSAPAPASTSTTTSKSTVQVAPKGASSEECLAASTALMKVTTIGMKASTGKVAASDLDAAFSEASLGKIPADARKYFDEIKVVSGKLVGLDAAAAGSYLGAFSSALATVTDATQKVCS